MGFKLNRTYRLVFEGGMEGAEVVFKTTPVSVVMEVKAGLGYETAAERVAEYVSEWNLEDADGNPLPVTAEAIKQHMEEPVLVKIVKEWMSAATGVTAPLDGPSPNGEPSQEALIPMDVL